MKLGCQEEGICGEVKEGKLYLCKKCFTKRSIELVNCKLLKCKTCGSKADSEEKAIYCCYWRKE